MGIPKIHCPVEGCLYWVGDGGYTVNSLDQLKTHVLSAHPSLPLIQRRRDGGIVDEMISRAVSEKALAATLYDAIAHGDEVHRAWLREAIDAHFAGKPVPPPRSILDEMKVSA